MCTVRKIYIYTYYISQFGLCTCICTEIRKYTENFYGFLPDWGIRDNFNFLLYIFKSEKRKEKNLKENKFKELFKFHNIQQEEQKVSFSSHHPSLFGKPSISDQGSLLPHGPEHICNLPVVFTGTF